MNDIDKFQEGGEEINKEMKDRPWWVVFAMGWGSGVLTVALLGFAIWVARVTG
jgi:hypothetical protein